MTQFSKVSMFAILVFESLICLGDEVEYIWAARWSIVKVLYLFTRYSAFIDTVIAVEERFSAFISTTSCNHRLIFNTGIHNKVYTPQSSADFMCKVFSGLGIGISDLILLIRTYVMYGNSRKILIVLVLSWSAISIVNIYAVLHWTSSFDEASTSSVISQLAPCSLVGESKAGLVNYASLLGGETVVVALTVYKGYQNYQDGKILQSSGTHQLLSAFYRDGILFYLFIFPITLGNVLILSLAPATLQVLETPLRVLHSVLCCRLVLHLREVAQKPADDEADSRLLEMCFRTTGTVEDGQEV
ncbi:hypothetical protein D9757_013139 [Collybiopsis confluens]|uniref:DUF6533 domain-containing protein n=1 Tax=Collybiopsis confluens TaxID=2823264 RepID=A0A8H5GSG5_9AGAR|nr:hypothetical protein D9757_013139 [Collybiopsis confluens]